MQMQTNGRCNVMYSRVHDIFLMISDLHRSWSSVTVQYKTFGIDMQVGYLEDQHVDILGGMVSSV
jgi:hypothetical protein